jgi:diadenosine tetraphosphatase ApaH/serine/threonine PP2A family protein phosphatase
MVTSAATDYRLRAFPSLARGVDAARIPDRPYDGDTGTVSSSSTAADEQPLENRYGERPPSSRVIRLLGVGALALAFLAWVVWATLGNESPGYGATLRSYEVVSPHEVRVQLDAHRPAHQLLVCDVSAQAQDHSVVGETLVRVPRGPEGDVVVTARVKTDRLATTAVLSTCH